MRYNNSFWNDLFTNRVAPQASAVTTLADASTVDLMAASKAGKAMKITRESSGGLPVDVSLIGGVVSATAEVTADLRGEGAPSPFVAADRVAWLGRPCALAAGYNGYSVPMFSGIVRELEASEAANSLTMSLVERTGALRSPVSIQTYGSYGTRYRPQEVRRYPTNASAVIVNALHTCGVRITPPPRSANLAKCVISVPLAFGALPDIGMTVPGGQGVSKGTTWLESAAWGTQRPMYLSGSNSQTFAFYPEKRTYWGSTSRVMIDFWATSWSSTFAHHAPIVLRIGAGAVRIRTVYVPGDGETTLDSLAVHVDVSTTMASWTELTTKVPVASGPLDKHISLNIKPTGYYELRINGAQVWTRTTTAIPTSNYGVYIDYMDPGVAQGLHVYFADTDVDAELTVATTGAISFTPAGVVAPALFDLDIVPEVDGVAAWDLIKTVVEAECGLAGFTEAGAFFFKTRAQLVSASTPVATVTADLVDDIAGSASLDSVRNVGSTVVAQQKLMYSGLGSTDDATRSLPSTFAQEVLTIPTGVSTFTIKADKAVMPLNGVVSMVTAVGATVNVDVGMVLCQDALGATFAASDSTNVVASIYPTGPKTFTLDIVNGSTRTLYAVWPAASSWTSPTGWSMKAGSPAFWINGAGKTTTDWPTVGTGAMNSASVAVYGKQPFVLEQSDWRQDQNGAVTLLTALMTECVAPRLELHDIEIPADLRYELGDPIKITDWAGRVPDITARIERIETTVSQEVENGMTQVISLRTIP